MGLAPILRGRLECVWRHPEPQARQGRHDRRRKAKLSLSLEKTSHPAQKKGQYETRHRRDDQRRRPARRLTGSESCRGKAQVRRVGGSVWGSVSGDLRDARVPVVGRLRALPGFEIATGRKTSNDVKVVPVTRGGIKVETREPLAFEHASRIARVKTSWSFMKPKSARR